MRAGCSEHYPSAIVWKPSSQQRCAVVRSEHRMKFGTSVWSAGKLLLLVGSLAATFLLFAGLAMRVALRTREVQVPNLVGRGVHEASQSLGALGLTLRVDQNRRPDMRVPAGSNMEEDPPPGVQARR